MQLEDAAVVMQKSVPSTPSAVENSSAQDVEESSRTGNEWVQKDKEEAISWIQQAGKYDLPSVCQKSLQACFALRERRNWFKAPWRPDPSGIPVEVKWGLLHVTHDELRHLGDRHAIQKALKEQDKTWKHSEIDAQFFVMRCERCTLSLSGVMQPAEIHDEGQVAADGTRTRAAVLQKSVPDTRAALSMCEALWLDGKKYRVNVTKQDGQCFYRAASMHEAGTLDDDDVRSYALRNRVIDYGDKWVAEVKGKEYLNLRQQIRAEMLDDLTWFEMNVGKFAPASFDFEAYFHYQRYRTTHAT